MRPILCLVCVLILGVVVQLGQAQKGPSPDTVARAAILKPSKSQTEARKKVAAQPDEFGPSRLGGNAVKGFWDEEEKILQDLNAALSAVDARAIKGKGASGSGAALAKDAGKIGARSEKLRKLAAKLVEKRLEESSTDRRKVLEGLIKKEGVEALRIATWGDATKSHEDGGNSHWKIGAGAVLVDWRTAGKDHARMTLRGRVMG